MRGAFYAITEIVLFVVAAGLLGLLLGLLIRRPRPHDVKAAAASGPARVEVERRLAAAQTRSDQLEGKLTAALTRVDGLEMENSKLTEIQAAQAALKPSVDVDELQAKSALVDRLEDELARRDSSLADKERELGLAAQRIAALEKTRGSTGDVDQEGDDDEEVPDLLPPRQNPTGPGAFTDVIEFEVGGAD